MSPSIGSLYLFNFSGATAYGCYVVTGRSYGPISDYAIFVSGPYSDCEDCGIYYTGTSVNQFYEYEGFCCESGVTSSGAAFPHPAIPTDTGIAIQLNAVKIGGFDGLNN